MLLAEDEVDDLAAVGSRRVAELAAGLPRVERAVLDVLDVPNVHPHDHVHPAVRELEGELELLARDEMLLRADQETGGLRFRIVAVTWARWSRDPPGPARTDVDRLTLGLPSLDLPLGAAPVGQQVGALGDERRRRGRRRAPRRPT